MYAYRTPNLYFELADDKRPSLTPLRTDIAGFVGIAARGPLHEAVKVESWVQFVTQFGSHIPQAYLAYAVEGFFANGGQTCYIVRVADPDQAQRADLLLRRRCDIFVNGRQPEFAENERVFHLTAVSPGVLEIGVVQSGDGRFILFARAEDGYTEIWRHLSIDPADPRYILNIVNPPPEAVTYATETGSRLVNISTMSPACRLQKKMCLSYERSQVVRVGAVGLQTLADDHFGLDTDRKWGLQCLEQVDDVSLVAMPDIMPKPKLTVRKHPLPVRCHELERQLPLPTAPVRDPEFPPVFDIATINRLQAGIIRHCQKKKDRFALLDSWDKRLTPDQIARWRIEQGYLLNSKVAAFYYPWLLVPDPLRLEGLVRPIPPSGYIAGMIARVDQQVGVHKPPANERLEAVKDVSLQMTERDHGRLNHLGVNVIRPFSGRGIRVAGARTLIPWENENWHEWGFVNVRRLLLMIMETIDERLQWTVFEPNNPELWRDIERVVGTFLYQLWQRGMLDGETAVQAFHVRCDAETNPPSETRRGRILCEIGIRPPWPAEFVIVRIGKTEGGIELVE